MFRPLGDRVVVKRDQTKEKVMESGLYIPVAAQDKPTEGVVVSVGNGAWRSDGKLWPPEVAVKDRVLFGKYAGTDFKVDGEDVVILREEEILGVL
jgi:chaperonin GroES